MHTLARIPAVFTNKLLNTINKRNNGGLIDQGVVFYTCWADILYTRGEKYSISSFLCRLYDTNPSVSIIQF